MASRVSDLLKIYGRHDYDPGDVMYHAIDGVRDGGVVNKERRYKIRKALHKLRLRATGMTDNIFGSKEVDGTLENKFEQTPKD